MAKSKKSKRAHGRLGRPPKDIAPDVEARILVAAQRVFFEKGYNGASINEIAELAPASKPTIYSHFPGKEALFAAVVGRVITGLKGFEKYTPHGRMVQEELTNLGTELAERFISELLGVTRSAIAEADRFPELSRRVREAGQDRAVNAISHFLGNFRLYDVPNARTLKGPFDKKRKMATAQIFMDLILLPILMRSLMVGKAEVLRNDLGSFIHERVKFFCAAYQTGWEP